MKCSNINCGHEMANENKICSKKSGGVFYFICEHCMMVHKVEIDIATYELKIGLAPDEDIENVKELMADAFKVDIHFDLT